MTNLQKWIVFLASAVFAAGILTIVASHARADNQQTIYSNDGNVVGRYTTDSQGTTTLYGRDGRVVGRASGATIMMDGVGGTIVGGRRIDGKIKKDKR